MKVLTRRTPTMAWKWPFLVCAAIGTFFSSLSCGGDSGPTAPVESVATVSITGAPSDGMMLVGQSATFTATARSSSGTVLTKAMSWTSSNPAVVSVSPSGQVSALAPGFAAVIAVVDGAAGTLELAVRVGLQTPAVGATQPTTSTAFNGAVTVTVPPAALTAPVALSVVTAVAANLPATSDLVGGTAFTFGPAGTQFATPIVLSLQFDPSLVSVSDREGLAVYLMKDGDWEEVPGSVVDLATSKVTAPVSHFSTYALLRRGAPASVSIVAGNNQSVAAGTAVPVAPSVRVTDSHGHNVPSAHVTFSVASGGGSVTGASQNTNGSGIATVGGWTLGAGGTNTLTATVGTLAPVTFTAMATASPPVATTLSIVAGNGQTADAGTAVSIAPSVKVLDQRGDPMSGVAVIFAVTGGGGSASGTSQTTSNAGIATLGSWTLGQGNNSLTATVSGISAVTFGAVGQHVAAHGVATALNIVTQPAGAIVGTAFVTQPVVEIVDAFGARVTTASGPVSVSLQSGSGTLGGTLIANATNGVATFQGLSIQGTGSFTLLFATGALVPAVSSSFTVTVVATHLSVITQPACAATGVVFGTQPVVDLLDATNARVLGANSMVAASVASGTGTLSGQTSVAAVNGRASFTNLKISGTGPHTLSFGTAGLPSTTSTSFIVTLTPCGQPQGADHLVVTAQPSSMTSGLNTGTFTVEARNANNDLVTSFESGPEASIALASGSGQLEPGHRAYFIGGIATIKNVRIDGFGAHSLIISTPGLASATTATVTVVQVPRMLGLTRPPASTAQGTLTTQPIITILDDANLPVDGSTDSARADVFFSQKHGTATGTIKVPFVHGVATFTNLGLTASGDYNLCFLAELTHLNVCSEFSIAQGAATALVVTDPPNSATSGGAVRSDLLRPLTVEVRDATGVPVTAYNSTVTVTVDSGSVVILAGGTATASAGVATFSSLRLGGVAGKFKLRFSAPGLPDIVSVTGVITQVAHHFAITTQPGGALNGVAFTSQPVLELRDTADFPMAGGFNVVVSLASGSGTLGFTNPAMGTWSDASGHVAFSGMKINGTGTFTLSFASPETGLPTVISNPFTVAP